MTDRVFIVDMGACTGCQTCAVACLDRADLGDDAWLLRVQAEEQGAFPNVTVRFRVAHCWHCERPACVAACAFGALKRRGDGLVVLDRTACTGCGACVAACAFGAVHLLDDGLAAKCDGCLEQLATGDDPVCVRACPMRALAYGPNDAFDSRPRIEDAGFQRHGLGPRVRYLLRSGAATVNDHEPAI